MKKILLLLAFLMFFCPVNVHAMSPKATVISYNSVKIKLKVPKKYKYWRIRKASYDKNGNLGKWKTVKILKRSKKTFTVKKLKKATNYEFEITVGVKKNGKYKAKEYGYISPVYTGLSMACWNDYAHSDALCSPTYIDLWGIVPQDGLPTKGVQIYRKVKGGTYKRIKTIKKKEFIFRDKNVEKGKTYYYKLRAYGKYKGKTIYSPWSEVMKRSAINQSGKFTSKLIKADPKSLYIELTSDKYNADLVFDQGAFYFMDDDEWEEQYLKITSAVKNGKPLSDLKKITLKAGESIYLTLERTSEDYDLTQLEGFESFYVKYENLPCYFYLTLNSTGRTAHNDEFIH